MQDKEDTNKITPEETKKESEQTGTEAAQNDTKDPNETLVKPSQELKEQKIKYCIMGKDVEIDPDATVNLKFY
jgi:hypothetical protein